MYEQKNNCKPMQSMIRKTLITAALLVSNLCFLHAATTEIHGKATDYAGKTLEFFVYEDFITEKTSPAFSLEIKEDGTFRQEFDISKTRPVFCLTGIYKLWFIAVPGETYELMLPDYIKKTKAEKYNPYFKSLLLMAGIKTNDKPDINNLVNQFEYAYDTLMNKNIEAYMTKQKASSLEQDIETLKQAYSQTKPVYFAAWKKFRFAMMRRLAWERNHRFVINKYFRQDSMHYQNPAYIELFNDIFKDYFDHFALRPDGEELIHAINISRSPEKISQVLSRMFELDNMALREYVIIKGLNDAYTRNTYKKESILTCLDSIAQFSKWNEHRMAASNVIEKFKHLAVGTPAPSPVLFSLKGDSISIRDFKDQYLYIAFFHTELIPCQKQIGLLTKMAKDHSNDLKVLLIIMDEDTDTALKNLSSGTKATVSIAIPENREEIKEIWEIASYPTYYLLDKESRLLFSPSPAPTENFENYFLDFVLR
jgi:thiol-disulfide isomerase/thioredoxin